MFSKGEVLLYGELTAQENTNYFLSSYTNAIILQLGKKNLTPKSVKPH